MVNKKHIVSNFSALEKILTEMNLKQIPTIKKSRDEMREHPTPQFDTWHRFARDDELEVYVAQNRGPIYGCEITLPEKFQTLFAEAIKEIDKITGMDYLYAKSGYQASLDLAKKLSFNATKDRLDLYAPLIQLFDTVLSHYGLVIKSNNTPNKYASMEFLNNEEKNGWERHKVGIYLTRNILTDFGAMYFDDSFTQRLDDAFNLLKEKMPVVLEHAKETARIVVDIMEDIPKYNTATLA